MHPDTHLVIQLQSLDQKIAALEKEVAALPKHIATIEKALESHNRKLEADRAALAANQKDRKRLEGEIQVHEQKISKLKGQMLEAKTNEQYKAFQHEIEYAQKEIRKAEDRILELMTESEPLDANVKRAEVALKEEKVVVEEEKTRARKRTAEDQGFIDQHKTNRAEVVAKLPKATVLTYDRVRIKSGGVAIAEVINSRCQACQITIRPQYLQDLRKGTELMRCEQCGRFLYINNPVSFEMLPPRLTRLVEFIESCDLAAVSYLSPEGTPQSAVVGIAVTPELEIVFDTVASSRKYRNLVARPECSIVMWKAEVTLQLEGIAEVTTSDHYKEAYFKKLPDGRDRLSWPGITYFVVRPRWVRYSDFLARPPLIEEFSF